MQEGDCTASILQPDGSQQDVRTFVTGEIFGEMALVEHGPRRASVRSESFSSMKWVREIKLKKSLFFYCCRRTTIHSMQIDMLYKPVVGSPLVVVGSGRRQRSGMKR